MRKGLSRLQHSMEVEAALDNEERDDKAARQEGQRKGGQSHLQDF